MSERTTSSQGDLGDFVILLLVGTLADLRDKLSDDGFLAAADLVADLVDIGDDYVHRRLGELRDLLSGA